MVRSAPLWLAWGMLVLLAENVSGQTSPSKNAPSTETKGNPPETTPRRLSVDKLKVPAGGILVLVEEIKDALALVPKMVLLTPEKYQEMLERIQTLERQLKSDKTGPSSCKLTGRADGDFVYLQAEFTFSTRNPRSSVLLGMQGAQLMDEGELDQYVPLLEYGEGGLLVKVDNAGAHLLRLRLKVPANLRRSGLPGTGSERGFELGLPGAAITRLSLELPASVRELRWNEALETKRILGRWEIRPPVTARTLSVSWKEPVAIPGIGPLPTADGQFTIKIEESHILIAGELTLQDLRGQMREWPLHFPAEARIEVKSPGGMVYELLPVENKPTNHLLRLAEPSSERWQVLVQVRQPRPQPGMRIPIGPFAVLGAYRQQGTMLVQAAPEALRGQRLVFHRDAEVFPRELPKSSARLETLAAFQYWNMPVPGKKASGSGGARAPLELEFKTEKGLGATEVEHALRVRGIAAGWQVDVTTRIKGKALHGNIDSLDLLLPRLRPQPAMLPAAWAPLGFPGSLPWGWLASSVSSSPFLAVPLDFLCSEDDVELVPVEGNKPAKLKWNYSAGKDFMVALQGRYFVPAGHQRVRLELPRPLGVVDRGAKTTIQIDEQWELLPLALGAEVARQKHQQEASWDQSPPHLELAWKPFRPEIPVLSITDLTIFERDAHVRHELTMHLPARAGRSAIGGGPIQLRVPLSVKVAEVRVSEGGKLLGHDADKALLLVALTAEASLGKEPVVLDYDFELPPSSPSEVEGKKTTPSRSFQVPLIWPEQASRLDSKVRIWCQPGIVPTLDPDSPGPPWKYRGTEAVNGQNSLPGLVLQASGQDLPLYISLKEPAGPHLAGGVFDRGLLQIAVDEEGTHHYRARFLVRKLNVRHLDVELPVPVKKALQSVVLGQKRINHWFPLEPNWHVARIPVEPGLFSQPVILDLEYKLPAGLTDGEQFGQTILYPPVFRDDIFLGRLRWQVSLPPTWLALPAESQTMLDYHWAIQGLLFSPEPAVTIGEAEQWLTGKDSADSPWPVSLAFWRSSLDPLRLWHLPRLAWLLLCSSLFLLVSLGLVLMPMARLAFWVLLTLVGVAVLAVAILWPALLPALLQGCQPGVLVLVLVLAVLWLLQERYRRQVVFMPGFTRLKKGSSLIRSSTGRPREPSTVDAPAEAAAPAGNLAKEASKLPSAAKNQG